MKLVLCHVGRCCAVLCPWEFCVVDEVSSLLVPIYVSLVSCVVVASLLLVGVFLLSVGVLSLVGVFVSVGASVLFGPLVLRRIKPTGYGLPFVHRPVVVM